MKAMNGVVKYQSTPALVFATRNDKFPKEKVNFEDEAYLIHFDGVLLNSEELKAQYGCSDNMTILRKLYEDHGAELVFFAKGLYSLVLWDKKAQTVLITNDLLSKRSIYYHHNDRALYYASSYYDLLNILSKEDYVPKINMQAVKSMVAEGFLTENHTYLQDVYYLNAFESLVVDLNRYSTTLINHRMKPVEINEETVLDRFEELFSSAVKRQFDKNAEYGYRQCVTLSGGMDSRACLLEAVRLGFDRDILCFNYAQSGSLDFKVSQEIANDLGLDYLFYPMDGAIFINRLQDAMNCNECQQSGTGSSAARTMATILNTDHFGIMNVGLCGGELMGDLIREESHGKQTKSIVSHLKRSLKLSGDNSVQYVFDMRKLLNHVRACQNFSFMFIDRCESVSPFMDEDVFMFVSQIDPRLLANRSMYRQWMAKYIPNSYTATHSCTSINGSALKETYYKAKYTIQKKLTGNSEREMNPYDYWFRNLKHHAENCTKEYEEGCGWLATVEGSGEILGHVKSGWSGSNWRKNLCVLTCLQAVKDVYNAFGRIR